MKDEFLVKKRKLTKYLIILKSTRSLIFQVWLIIRCVKDNRLKTNGNLVDHVSSQKRWKRLFFRWTAPKGFTTMALFSALAVFTEYVLVCFFLSFGLVDKSLFTENFQVPLTNLFFTITVSPLFHLIPLGVVVVLVASWMHLTKYVAVVPHKVEPVKRPLTTRKRRYPRPLEKYLKPIRRFSRGIGRRFRRVSRALKGLYRRASAAVLRIRSVSYVMQRLFSRGLPSKAPQSFSWFF